MKVYRPKARSPLASNFRRLPSRRPGWSRSGRPPRAPIANPMTEPSIQATPAVASTIHILSLPSPASAPAAMSDASPGPGIPAPMIATSTNMMAYSDRLMASHLQPRAVSSHHLQVARPRSRTASRRAEDGPGEHILRTMQPDRADHLIIATDDGESRARQ